MSETKQKQNVLKSVNTELKQVLFIAMSPDEVDAHGDITSEDEVRKACQNYNLHCRKANLFHIIQETDTFDIVESYIAPSDIQIGEYEVKKGTWLVNLQVYDDELWELVKSGEVNGVSINAWAKTEQIKED